MKRNELVGLMDSRIAKYDLLCHPFYRAWSSGELTRKDIGEYAQDYYHHVRAFPTYLAELTDRLDDGKLREELLANMADENGTEDASGVLRPAHSDLWLDFAEGMGAPRAFTERPPITAIQELITFFHQIATEATPERAIASFYAYESQVPRVANVKARGLREMYGADERTCAYFTLHTTADVYHSQVWQLQLERLVDFHPELKDNVLDAAENAARALWRSLDGIEARRIAKALT